MTEKRITNVLTVAAAAMLLVGVLAPCASAASLSGLALSGGNYQWPTTTILAADEQTSAIVDATSGHDIKSNRDQGETFTITQDGTIKDIAFNFEAFNSGGSANITFKFFKVVSATNPTMVGSVIDSITITAAAITSLGFAHGAQGVLVVDVADTAVSAGDTYALQLDTGSDSNLILKWRRDNAGSYLDGQSFGTVAAPDYHFGVYGSVPTPGTLIYGK